MNDKIKGGMEPHGLTPAVPLFTRLRVLGYSKMIAFGGLSAYTLSVTSAEASCRIHPRVYNRGLMRRRIKTALTIVAVFFLCGSSSSFENNKLLHAKILAKIQIPKWYHEGLYFDGKNIWVNNGEDGKTWIVDTSSGSVIKEIEPVGTFTESITLKSNNLFFVTDWSSEKIYTIRIEKGRMIAQSEVCVSPAHPAGAIWNGSNLFVITWARTLAGTKFHIIKMDDKFNVVTKKRIDRIQEPAHLAWDGKNLWISSWYDRRVYKVGPENFEIMGYFKSPVERTTGIAWDGKYLWLTGTNADLYKIEIALNAS